MAQASDFPLNLDTVNWSKLADNESGTTLTGSMTAIALSSFDSVLEVETELELNDPLQNDHIYSVYLQLERPKEPGFYESFVCATRYSDIEELQTF